MLRPVLEVHVCPACTGEKVYPEKTAHDQGCFTVTMVCPDCNWQWHGRLDAERVDQLHYKYELGRAAVHLASMQDVPDDLDFRIGL